MSYQEYKGSPDSGQLPLNLLPAVAIGGPPHAGKSVLAYSLTQSLRELKTDHYVLRAYPPDCEGDWFLAGEPPFVRHFRIKGARSEAWLPLLKRDIARRHLPLIVDMGGFPTQEQETILDICTHAILLTRDASSHEEWADRMAQHGLVLLADLRSNLHGTDKLTTVGPPVKGQLAGLERGCQAAGPGYEALTQLLATRFAQATQGLRRKQLAACPIELAVDLRQLAARFDVDPSAWATQDLRRVLAYLPQGKPLGLYGRGPNWMYAAVAAHARPADFVHFDVRCGWVMPPHLRPGQRRPTAPWELERKALKAGTLWTFRLPDAYLDINEAEGAELPPWPTTGLILSGKMPHWLTTALVRAYDGPWLAVMQPHSEVAVVVYSNGTSYVPGDQIPIPEDAIRRQGMKTPSDSKPAHPVDCDQFRTESHA